MANVNDTRMLSEKFLSTPQVKRAASLHGKRIQIAESIRTKAGKAPLTLETKAALATCLENTRQICEATQSSHIPSKTFFMDMVASVIPNTIAPEIVSVQAMDSKAGMVSYLRFVYGDNKGKTQAGTMFNNSLYKGTSDPDYSSRKVEEEVVFTADGGETTAELDFYPIIPEAIKAYVDGEELAKPTIEGTTATFTTGVGGSTLTVNLLNGHIEIGAAADLEVTFAYEYDNETAPVKVPQINLELAQIPMVAKSRKLAAYWGFDAAFDLKKQYGEDVTALMATQAAGEIAHEIDTEIVLDLYAKAGAGAELVWSRTAPVGVNLVDHYDSFYAKLTEGKNIIFGATQRYNPNFICCGLNVASVIEVMRNFDGTGAGNGVGPHFIGTLGGTYKIYVVPAMNPDTFVMGFKGNNFLETGYVYAPYMPVLSTDLLTTADMVGQQGYATSYAKKMVNAKLYLKGKIVD